jgi:hypothetical protein
MFDFTPLFDYLRTNPRPDPGRIEVDPGGGYRLSFADGSSVPALEQHDNGKVRCPNNCSEETHEHGILPDSLSLRNSHCAERQPGEHYAVLRPTKGLLGIGLRWWALSRVPFPPLTFTKAGR